MIDLDKYEDAITFKQELELGGISVCRDDVLDIITRLRQAEKDAARYREIAMDAKGILLISGDYEAANAIYEAVIDVRNN